MFSVDTCSPLTDVKDAKVSMCHDKRVQEVKTFIDRSMCKDAFFKGED